MATTAAMTATHPTADPFPFTVTDSVRDWLASIGYPIGGRSERDIETMFLWEAAKLEIAPNLLQRLIESMWEI